MERRKFVVKIDEKRILNLLKQLIITIDQILKRWINWERHWFDWRIWMKNFSFCFQWKSTLFVNLDDLFQRSKRTALPMKNVENEHKHHQKLNVRRAYRWITTSQGDLCWFDLLDHRHCKAQTHNNDRCSSIIHDEQRSPSIDRKVSFHWPSSIESIRVKSFDRDIFHIFLSDDYVQNVSKVKLNNSDVMWETFDVIRPVSFDIDRTQIDSRELTIPKQKFHRSMTEDQRFFLRPFFSTIVHENRSINRRKRHVILWLSNNSNIYLDERTFPSDVVWLNRFRSNWKRRENRRSRCFFFSRFYSLVLWFSFCFFVQRVE